MSARPGSGQHELEDADRLAAAGHGRDHADAVVVVHDLRLLAGEDPAVRRLGERDAVRGLGTAVASVPECPSE